MLEYTRPTSNVLISSPFPPSPTLNPIQNNNPPHRISGGTYSVHIMLTTFHNLFTLHVISLCL